MESALTEAIVKVDSGSSLQNAALETGVSYSSLRRHINKEGNQRRVMAPNGQLLYEEEEEYLKEYIVKSAENGFPRTVDDICQAAGKILAAFPRPIRHDLSNGVPTRHFVRRFMQRHPDLSFRKPSNMSVAGASVSKETMDAWFSWFKKFLIDHNLTDFYDLNPSNIFNCDETPLGCNMAPTKAAGQKKLRRVHRVAPPNSKEQFTALITGNASGKFLKPFMVLKGQRISPELRASIPENVDFTLTDGGYMTQEAFLGEFILI